MLSLLFADGGFDGGTYDKNSWHILQAFDFFADLVRPNSVATSLVILVAENLGSQDRYLDVACRRDAHIKAVEVNPLPGFPENDMEGSKRVQTYLRRRFRVLGDKVEFRRRKNCQELIEEWEPIECWKPNTQGPPGNSERAAETSPILDHGLKPFTVLHLGPFSEKKKHAIALRLSIEGSNYDSFIGDFPRYLINGQELIVSCIQQEDQPQWPHDSKWEELFQRIKQNLCAPTHHEFYLAKEPLSKSFRYGTSTPSIIPIYDIDEDNKRDFDHFVTCAQDYRLELRLDRTYKAISNVDIPVSASYRTELTT
jgi:hypothetical protein